MKDCNTPEALACHNASSLFEREDRLAPTADDLGLCYAPVESDKGLLLVSTNRAWRLTR